MPTLQTHLHGLPIVQLHTYERLYHGLRRLPNDPYFTGGHWLSMDIGRGVHYAFLRDSHLDFEKRQLLCCNPSRTLNLVDISDLRMDEVTLALNKKYGIPGDDKWIRLSFCENATAVLNTAIDGYITRGGKELFISDVELNLTVARAIL